MVSTHGTLPQELQSVRKLSARTQPRRQQFWGSVERSGAQPQQPCSCKRLKLDISFQASCSSPQGPASRLRTAAAATEAPPANEGPSTSETGGRGRRGPKRAPSPDDVAPGLPVPCEFQQTLARSFTIGGLGLHTGEYAYVRVRPAFADEGRYFVRVPEGTNSHLFSIDEARPMGVEDEALQGGEMTTSDEDTQVNLFCAFLEDQDRGFEGTFADWTKTVLGDREEAYPLLDWFEMEVPDEDIQERAPDEGISAELESIEESCGFYTQLGSGDDRIQGVQSLLSALEACGIDNARIEIEGGCELPIIDGSPLGWCISIHKSLTRPAVRLSEPTDAAERLVLNLKQPITVQKGNSFISLYPSDRPRLTVGLDHHIDAPIIGKQWVTWCPLEDEHFRWTIGAARWYAPTGQHLVAMREAGYIKGGTEGCCIIGFGDRWYDESRVRYINDEPARHKMCNLIGDLALLAQPGKGGMPLGHIIAYQPDHDLQLQFLAAIRQAATEDDYVPFTVVMSQLYDDLSRIADVEEHLESADQSPFLAEDQKPGSPSNPTVAKYNRLPTCRASEACSTASEAGACTPHWSPSLSRAKNSSSKPSQSLRCGHGFFASRRTLTSVHQRARWTRAYWTQGCTTSSCSSYYRLPKKISPLVNRATKALKTALLR
ncbi:hypothetical protein WJX74_011056 [Apatococcus lobatus]|uniref:UDP-3-O-acyl-N-acetylglucosamine deacetylase n=1 Tax=Apatococcus lobatus TaxID=904363 RepID=A0AAW1QH13_9CHLO